ncbi:chemotaxis regulator - transmits chemoreceptor signals to flagelllar motor components CheY [Halorhodospira halochloris]|uniref:Chemotaxis regulator-transmits chemoreceptor signals to flagelllar motor components CheY n=2 Tax=Halorhodospira halochloris TaxID=1052 RepID=A0A120MZK2_HALHR|nr:chemotaxis regulator - transmits chemoreceptor signals to flagelllar motor components CheY [Halorhodospira halochloris]
MGTRQMGEIDYSNKSALVVDDIPNMRSTLREMLRSIGIKNVTDVSTGERALEALDNGDFDVVLCDYNLGRGKDGQQVLEEARYRGLIRLSTVFIMVTAESAHYRVMGTVEHQPDDYLTKPLAQALLAKRIERHLLRRQGLRAIDYAVSLGAYERAIEVCDQFLAKGVGNPDELMRLKLDYCLRLARHEQAEQVCREALQSRRVAWALTGIGRVRMAQGKLAEARKQLQEALDEHPNYMEAYDLLADVLVRIDDIPQAQQLLDKALDISPNSVVRQRRLGEVARSAGDTETAERAYRRAAALGKGSVQRSHTDYAELAKIQAVRGAPEINIEQTLGDMRREARGRGEAGVEAALAEAAVYRELGREEQAAKAYAQAGDAYNNLGGNVSAKVALELGQAALTQGDTELGMATIKQAVKNHHDDEKVINQAQALLAKSGMGEEGERTIKALTQDVRDKNNRGVALARQGKLQDSVRLFEQALKELSMNVTVNLNAAQVYLMLAKQGDDSGSLLRQAESCLDRVEQLDPQNTKLHSLQGVSKRLRGQDQPY